jgi:hypothetical protein
MPLALRGLMVGVVGVVVSNAVEVVVCGGGDYSEGHPAHGTGSQVSMNVYHI